MRRSKIHLQGQLAIRRGRGEPLSQQLVRQLEEAIEAGRVSAGAQLPSTRALARKLGVSRNTVIAAYEELASRGLVRGRRGAGMFVVTTAPPAPPSIKRLLQEAQFPAATISLRDHDGNALYISY